MSFASSSRKLHKSSTPPKPVAIESEAESDDLSDAFHSLSLQSEPIPQTVKPALKGKFPKFPMARHPKCRRCGWIPKYRGTVKYSNPNGNYRRPYFICIRCKRNALDPNRPRLNRKVGWISWDDYIGVHENNRPCFCGFVCRQDRAGVDSFCPGAGFWTCATGSCGFVSFRSDALTNEEASYDGGFEPWLLRT